MDSNHEPRKRLTPHAVRAFVVDMFYVYLLHSIADAGFYIGYSTDLKRRLSEHKQGAAFATKHRGPWKLIYYEAYVDRDDAEGRERYLKRCWEAFLTQTTTALLQKIPTSFSRVRRKPFTRATPHGFEP
jgi:putative endonuclease